MAVEKRKIKNGEIRYRAYWNNPFTQRREVGPWETTKHEASKLSDLKKYQIKNEREKLAVDEEPQSNVLTVSKILMLYCTYAKMRDSTRESALRMSKQINKTLGDIPTTSLTHELCQAFEEGQLARGVGLNTIYNRLAMVRAAINWAILKKKMPAPNPMDGYKLTRGETEKIIPPTPKEVESLLKYAPAHLIRAISLAYYFGVRVGPSELLRIQWSHIDLDSGIATIMSAKKGGDPWRRLQIKPEFLKILRKWQAEDEKTGMEYCVHYRGKPISCIKRSWAKTKANAGITRRLRPYDLRHAFATYALEHGADVGAVARVMGHRNTIMIHKHYQHVLDAQKRQVTASIPTVKIPQK